MSDPDLLPPPVVELPVPAENKWHREYRAFLRLLPELLKTHKGKYAAIHEERCVDTDEDKIALALRVYAKYGYIPIHVGLVAEEPEVARMPSHRTLWLQRPR